MGLKVPGCRYRLMQLRTFEGGYNQRQPEGYFLSITYVDGFCQESLNTEENGISVRSDFPVTCVKWYKNGC